MVAEEKAWWWGGVKEKKNVGWSSEILHYTWGGGDEHVTAGLSVGGEVGVENPAFPPAKR